MTDVFISYAREDRKFVQRLHGALSGDGHQAWVDWEGIPASAKWMAEVRAAIDEADCFCFVGQDLTSAESWLGSSQGKEPASTQLYTA